VYSPNESTLSHSKALAKRCATSFKRRSITYPALFSIIYEQNKRISTFSALALTEISSLRFASSRQ
jgi:hypothetical protein